MVAYLGYSYVYRPLFALSNYRAGYAQIRADRFTSANESFNRATRTWKIKNWYFRYAEAFADKRQYVLAEEKYEQILRDYPGDRKGILDYAHLETTRLADYEKADRLLQAHPGQGPLRLRRAACFGGQRHRVGRRVPEKYQAARLAYAMLIEQVRCARTSFSSACCATSSAPTTAAKPSGCAPTSPPAPTRRSMPASTPSWADT